MQQLNGNPTSRDQRVTIKFARGKRKNHNQNKKQNLPTDSASVEHEKKEKTIIKCISNANYQPTLNNSSWMADIASREHVSNEPICQ